MRIIKCEYCGREKQVNNKRQRFCSKKCSGKSQIKDITGQVFGDLKVLKLLEERYDGHTYWLCECTCGNETKVPINFLRTGHKISCGCAKHKNNWVVENHKEYYKGTNILKIKNNTPIKSNKSGIPGVHQHVDGYWIARINFKGKRIYLGYFKEFDDAVKVRKEAEEKYYLPIIEEFENMSDIQN